MEVHYKETCTEIVQPREGHQGVYDFIQEEVMSDASAFVCFGVLVSDETFKSLRKSGRWDDIEIALGDYPPLDLAYWGDLCLGSHPAIIVAESLTTAYVSEPNELPAQPTPREIMRWTDVLKRACEELDIPYEEPRWWLMSNLT